MHLQSIIRLDKPKAEQKILNKIYAVRGQRVMLDEDQAAMYGVETRRLNEQVKRNLKRFPPDFMFTLTAKEYENLKSQNATSSWGGEREPGRALIIFLNSVADALRSIGTAACR